jgi:hypothetical protein
LATEKLPLTFLNVCEGEAQSHAVRIRRGGDVPWLTTKKIRFDDTQQSKLERTGVYPQTDARVCSCPQCLFPVSFDGVIERNGREVRRKPAADRSRAPDLVYSRNPVGVKDIRPSWIEVATPGTSASSVRARTGDCIGDDSGCGIAGSVLVNSLPCSSIRRRSSLICSLLRGDLRF